MSFFTKRKPNAYFRYYELTKTCSYFKKMVILIDCNLKICYNTSEKDDHPKVNLKGVQSDEQF